MSLSSSEHSALSGSLTIHRASLEATPPLRPRSQMPPSIESPPMALPSLPPVPDIALVSESTSIKKGVLWEQQQNRFFFNRWKERFFILTTDYLSCFKKAPRKAVGMSEMGSFVYKINLNEIKTLTWVDKKKNGVIGVQLANTVIFLWNTLEGQLDEWMSVLQESTSKTKVRRETLRKSATLLPNMNGNAVAGLGRSPLHLIERNSPNLFNVRTSGTTARPRRDSSEQRGRDSFSPLVATGEITLDQLVGVVPPPPPPRRYLRCQSSTGTADNVVDDYRPTQSPRPRNEKLSLVQEREFYKVNMANSASDSNEHDNDSEVERRIVVNGKNIDKTRKGRDSANTQSLRVRSSYHLSPLINSSSGSPTSAKPHQPNVGRAATSKRLSSIGQFGSLYNQQHYNHQQPQQQQHQQQQLPPRPKHQTLSHQQLPPRPSSQSLFRPLPQQPPAHRVRDVDDLFTTESSDFSFIATRSISIDPYQRNGAAVVASTNAEVPPPLPPLPSHRSSSGSRMLPSRHSTISSSASLMLNGTNGNYRHRSRVPLETGTFAGRGGVVAAPPVPPHRTHIHHF